MITKVSVYRETPATALQRAIGLGGWPSMVSSRRYRRWQGRPGEIIEKMSEADRTLLQGLSSLDVAEETVGPFAAWLSSSKYDEEVELRDLLERFDRNMLKLPEPIRHLRRQRTGPWFGWCDRYGQGSR